VLLSRANTRSGRLCLDPYSILEQERDALRALVAAALLLLDAFEAEGNCHPYADPRAALTPAETGASDE